ncbi:hypothetical protein C8046_16690 [Serinibacter arcticus]|uniref:Uncharacterized protein n=1 Tax=Serinibacter arcticus TaxID=1655435 RepID=A0A2U1ZYH4_9MICO|nr:hypothetical protein [Serinibacter arcticus]PWD52037.1 hypothetical protein C8046_16690 [Serinibacter arcticus]
MHKIVLSVTTPWRDWTVLGTVYLAAFPQVGDVISLVDENYGLGSNYELVVTKVTLSLFKDAELGNQYAGSVSVSVPNLERSSKEDFRRALVFNGLTVVDD